MAGQTSGTSLGARRGRRIALAIFVAFAAAFILSSTWQVWNQVFGTGARGGTASQPCSGAARAFEEEVDRAITHAARMHSPESARDEFEDALNGGTGLVTVEKRCTAGPADRDTYVAAVRLRETAEASAEQQAAVLARVRKALEARAER